MRIYPYYFIFIPDRYLPILAVEILELLEESGMIKIKGVVRSEVSAASLVPLCLLLDELNKTLKAVVRALDIFHSFSVFVQSCWDEGLNRCFLQLAIFILIFLIVYRIPPFCLVKPFTLEAPASMSMFGKMHTWKRPPATSVPSSLLTAMAPMETISLPLRPAVSRSKKITDMLLVGTLSFDWLLANRSRLEGSGQNRSKSVASFGRKVTISQKFMI